MPLGLSHFIVGAFAFLAGYKVAGRPTSSSTARLRRYDDSPLDDPQADEAPQGLERWGIFVFLTGWLIAWTFGILSTFAAFVQGGSMLLMGWLIAAAAGWVIGAESWLSLLHGRRPRFWRNR